MVTTPLPVEESFLGLPPSGALSQGQVVRLWRLKAENPRARLFGLIGRGDFFELYEDTIREVHQRGYDVLMMEWPGQGHPMNGRFSKDGRYVHIPNMAIYDDSLESVVSGTAWESNRELPTFSATFSMGAGVALHTFLTRPHLEDKFAGHILVNPMLAINWRTPWPLIGRPIPEPAQRFYANIMGKINPDGPARGQRHVNPVTRSFNNNPITTNVLSHEERRETFAAHPDKVMGGSTWGFASSVIAYTDNVKNLADQGKKLQKPTIMVVSDMDPYISPEKTKKLATSIGSQILSIPHARHAPQIEHPEIREMFFSGLRKFIDGVLEERSIKILDDRNL
ncbi:MAG: alpha/beta hydrolase [Alphaproteobacteria bacterium]